METLDALSCFSGWSAQLTAAGGDGSNHPAWWSSEVRRMELALKLHYWKTMERSWQLNWTCKRMLVWNVAAGTKCNYYRQLNDTREYDFSEESERDSLMLELKTPDVESVGEVARPKLLLGIPSLLRKPGHQNFVCTCNDTWCEIPDLFCCLGATSRGCPLATLPNKSDDG